MTSVAVMIPCYKRPEYTEKCIDGIKNSQTYENTKFFLYDDGSNDATDRILKMSGLPSEVIVNERNLGLRNCVIDFFDRTSGKFDYLIKMDNDCVVPPDWIERIIYVFKNSDADILSPNVFPSNAAFKNGTYEDGKLYRPSKTVGGLWAMRGSLPTGVFFEKFSSSGICGAWQVLNQIILEKDARVGWIGNLTVQDIGHWSGTHKDHIKSEAHAEYSAEVGRPIAW